MIWSLIHKFMKDTEHANRIAFTDSAWQRAKQLDADIQAEVAKERDELVKSADALIDEQDARIKELEGAIKKVIYGVRGIDLPCEKWVTRVLSQALPGFDQIDPEASNTNGRE